MSDEERRCLSLDRKTGALMAGVTDGAWDRVLAALGPPENAAANALLADAPVAWVPAETDIAVLRAVLDGEKSIDDLSAWLHGQWNADTASDEGRVSPGMTDATATAATAVLATRAKWLLGRAKEAKVILERIRKAPASGIDTGWLKRTAQETLAKSGPAGASGALGQFRGHLFEQLDSQTYNLRNLPYRRVLALRTNAHAPGYDASRYINGRFAGGVQHKLSAAGVLKAAEKLNARKAGSASRATLRLPKDQAARARIRVAGRMRVEASDISSAVLKRRGNAGLKQLAGRGSRAVNPAHQLGRSAGLAALSAATLGALSDAARLYRGEMNRHEFAARRGTDAVEQSASHLAGIAATAGVFAGLKSVAAGGGILAGSAATAASSTVVLPFAVTAVVGSTVVYSLRPVRRRAQSWAAERARMHANGRQVPPVAKVRVAGRGRSMPPPLREALDLGEDRPPSAVKGNDPEAAGIASIG
ncbi:hypothetical protein O6072_18400 [Mycolicibacterium neoaurum]|uniref:hypothetical protein n=1 Tax=Mycolicibacterium neoaurum TaxID=1795 RepID=UPI00248B7A35|nr:hypothetical protein [Mycolicibacterium neoaurum]WBP93207.1 hypothetical protein O7W24_18845 [Mycolicibacterium neoaurum]WBS06826.1 hypothetical protein O6072_18400 [Mycolicibacterium neoaurum]